MEASAEQVADGEAVPSKGGHFFVLLEGRLVDAASGAELLLYYGRLSCLQQLQFYGFIAAEQLSREVIAVDLEMPDEAVAVASLEEAAAAAEAQAALRVGLMRRHGLGLRLSRPAGVPNFDRAIVTGGHDSVSGWRKCRAGSSSRASPATK